MPRHTRCLPRWTGRQPSAYSVVGDQKIVHERDQRLVCCSLSAKAGSSPLVRRATRLPWTGSRAPRRPPDPLNASGTMRSTATPPAPHHIPGPLPGATLEPSIAFSSAVSGRRHRLRRSGHVWSGPVTIRCGRSVSGHLATSWSMAWARHGWRCSGVAWRPVPNSTRRRRGRSGPRIRPYWRSCPAGVCSEPLSSCGRLSRGCWRSSPGFSGGLPGPRTHSRPLSSSLLSPQRDDRLVDGLRAWSARWP